MSLFSTQQRVSNVQGPLIPPRVGYNPRAIYVDQDSAMRHSAVWACLRLRGDLISTMPIDAYRKIGDIQVEVSKPPVLLNPGGTEVDMTEWMYSSQVDVDRSGNTCGLIIARDGLGYPSIIELQSLEDTTIKIKDRRIEKFKFGRTWYEPGDVWHEKQYTVAGLPIGLSPVSYASMSIGQYLSAQKFATDWFSEGGMPSASLRNTQKTVDPKDALEIKAQFRAVVANGDVFVHGADWEYKPMNAIETDNMWINTQQYGIPDIARFFGAPADLIDAAVSGSAVTYASISQRNLQALIMNIGPAVTRRENALSRLLPKPRFVKLNRNALLAMDPEAQSRVLGLEVKDRLRTPNEAREKLNLAPLTEAQYAEFDRLFGGPKQTPTNATTGA